MAEEIITTTPGGEPTPQTNDTNTDYIAAIANLRANTVSKEEYEKVKSENKKLLETLIEGGQVETPQTGPTTEQINGWAAQLMRGDCAYNDLELAKASLNLRNACLEMGLPDQYVRQGKNIKPTPEDLAAAEATAQALRESIEAAKGDNARFCHELEERLADSGIPTVPSGRRYF